MTSIALPDVPRLGVLVLADFYPPASKAGGPVKTLSRIVDREAVHHDITVVTRDRDLGESTPLPLAARQEVTRRGRAAVHYIRPRSLRMLSVIVAESRKADLVYVNSLFSPLMGLVPLLLVGTRVVRPSILLVAPRGQLAPGALSISRRRKRPFLAVIKLLLSRRADVVWHASTSREASEVGAALGVPQSRTLTHLNPPPTPAATPSHGSTDEAVHLVFLARMVPIKNFSLIAQALQHVRVPVEITAVGTLEDERYWRECCDGLVKARPFAQVRFAGHLSESDVVSALKAADAMILPTRSESFGHAIAESLAVGTPVLIPDTTHWTATVRTGGGWLIDPDDPHALADLIDALSRSGSLRDERNRRAVLASYHRWYDSHDSRGSLFSKAARYSRSRVTVARP